jgi:hypothetical protein
VALFFAAEIQCLRFAVIGITGRFDRAETVSGREPGYLRLRGHLGTPCLPCLDFERGDGREPLRVQSAQDRVADPGITAEKTWLEAVIFAEARAEPIKRALRSAMDYLGRQIGCAFRDFAFIEDFPE